MLRIIFISAFFIMSFCSISALSQTYYYENEASIQNGVRSKITGGKYFTFSDNMKICYESDKDGYAKYGGNLRYTYVGTQDNKHIYESGMTVGFTNCVFSRLIFSNDFSRYNQSTYGLTTVGNRKESPTEAPVDFY